MNTPIFSTKNIESGCGKRIFYSQDGHRDEEFCGKGHLCLKCSCDLDLTKRLAKEVSRVIDDLLPLEIDEKNPDNCNCIACVRETFRRELKSRLFGEGK